jgi:hypothetical protein
MGETVSRVALVSNRLYRRASSLQPFLNVDDVGKLDRFADWKSAIQPVGNQRYSAISIKILADTLSTSLRNRMCEFATANPSGIARGRAHSGGGVKMHPLTRIGDIPPRLKH